MSTPTQAPLNAALHQDAVAEQLQATMRRHKAATRQNGPTAVGPGGRVVDATPYLRNLHLQNDHASQFGLIDKEPEKFLRNPRPGFHYVWVATSDQTAKSRINSGRYTEVLVSDLLDEHDMPFQPGKLTKLSTTNKGAVAGQGVFVYDLQLCSVSPEAWDALFGVREALGMARVSSGLDKFMLQAQAEGVEADIEITPVN